MHLGDAHRRQVLESGPMRVPVLVAGPGRDQRDPRPQCRQEGQGGSRVGAVVRDFQDVHTTDDAACQEPLFDGRLRVAGEQRAQGGMLEQGHHRCVVDVVVGERRSGIGLARVEDYHPRAGVQRHDLAGPCQLVAASRFGGRRRHEARIARVVVRPARVEDQAHPESLQHPDQPRDVILVRVGHDHQPQVALPEGEHRAQAAQHQLGVRAAVDQRRRARWAPYHDRVALADVQHPQVQPAVGP